jgi:hypothetical protein
MLARLAFAALLASAGTAQSNPVILDFDPNIACGSGVTCANHTRIDNTYGDVAGIIDIIYDRDILTTSSDDRLSHWNANYSDLTDVAWGAANDSSGRAEIFISPLAGHYVTLHGFDLGSYPNTTRNSSISILSGTNAVLANLPLLSVDGQTHYSYDTAHTSNTGIRIQWGPSAYNVGIDNIEFSWSRTPPGPAPIPVPASLPLIATALVGLGLIARRRRS